MEHYQIVGEELLMVYFDDEILETCNDYGELGFSEDLLECDYYYIYSKLENET